MSSDSDEKSSVVDDAQRRNNRRKKNRPERDQRAEGKDEGRSRKKKKRKLDSRDDKKGRKSKKSKKDRKRHRKRSASSDSSSSSESDRKERKKTEIVMNERLLEKLAARGETLEERKARRALKRQAHIAEKFGYTAEENPFGDSNLHDTFTWKKRDAKKGNDINSVAAQSNTFLEIDKVRNRRKEREDQFVEMERLRAEESRMKELENYDDWARKEEEFHLQQQRQRSAIRLVEGREKPIDILAKNILMFGLSDQEKKDRASVKYQERYDALDAIESLEAELEEPQFLLKHLKQKELEDLMVDVDAFLRLEREASMILPGTSVTAVEKEHTSTVIQYWSNVRVVAEDEIKYLHTGGSKGQHASMVKKVATIFEDQSVVDLIKMKSDIGDKLRQHARDPLFQEGAVAFDHEYWTFVHQQIVVHIAKADLGDLHSKMLVRQLEHLEQKKEKLSAQPLVDGEITEAESKHNRNGEERDPATPSDIPAEFGDLEEELGLKGEVDVTEKSYSWQDKFRPRKPRYFNRVKTGYDWNKYNQTHYDKDNPPPKTVQGYKFNIFYPDLIDSSKTPQYTLERADTDEFCIIRFRAGPPYEDIAFKIINREWNRSRKRGFKCSFERGVLSLYFNFTTHWYRK